MIRTVPTEEEILASEALARECAKSMVNLYACENVCFGKITQNEKVPIYRYIEELELLPFYDSEDFDGRDIEGGCIRERDFDERCFDIFKDKVKFIFSEVPVDKRFAENDDDVYHYKFGLYDYIKQLYPLFRKIVATEVIADRFAVKVDKKLWYVYCVNAARFVLDIKMKVLLKGNNADSYIKNLPYIPIMIGRLLTYKEGNYYLKNDDTDSLDFKFALFSCFMFYSVDNFRLFEVKMLNYSE